MAEKKKTSAQKKPKIDRAPSLKERITDFSIGGYGKPVFTPKKDNKK